MKRKHPALVEFGNKVRKLRIAQGYSQENFGFEVGLHRTYIGGIERGERNIAIINVMKIAITLKVEVGDLFPSLRFIELF